MNEYFVSITDKSGMNKVRGFGHNLTKALKVACKLAMATPSICESEEVIVNSEHFNKTIKFVPSQVDSLIREVMTIDDKIRRQSKLKGGLN